MCDKMAISAYIENSRKGHILKLVEKDTFLKLQMRSKEDFKSHQFFPNRWSIFW